MTATGRGSLTRLVSSGIAPTSPGYVHGLDRPSGPQLFSPDSPCGDDSVYPPLTCRIPSGRKARLPGLGSARDSLSGRFQAPPSLVAPFSLLSPDGAASCCPFTGSFTSSAGSSAEASAATAASSAPSDSAPLRLRRIRPVSREATAASTLAAMANAKASLSVAPAAPEAEQVAPQAAETAPANVAAPVPSTAIVPAAAPSIAAVPAPIPSAAVVAPAAPQAAASPAKSKPTRHASARPRTPLKSASAARRLSMAN